MRILMTTDTVGGVWQYTLELCAHLLKNGHEVDLVTSGPAPAADQLRDAGALSGLRLHIEECRLEWMEDPWDDLERWLDALLAVQQHAQPDVIHSNTYCVSAMRSWEVPLLLVAHSCVGTWWQAVHGCAPPAEYTRYMRMVQGALQAADKVVAPTMAYAEAVSRTYGLGGIEVVYNGGAEGFRPLTKRSIVAGSGRLWDEAKNVRCVVGAANDIHGPVLIAGAGGEQGRGSQARWLGRLDRGRMRELLGEAAVFVHPARYEPFGLGVLEAASSACALVLGDIPTLREIWGDAAIYTDPDDPCMLAWNVNSLLINPPRRALFARAAQQRAQMYRPELMCESYERHYHSLLRQPAHAARREVAQR